MIKKIKNYIQKFKQKNEQKDKLKNAQEYYKILQSGALFLKFIEQDLAQMKKQQVNRQLRRRFDKSLHEKGKFSKEMIEHYSIKVNNILNYINEQLNSSKKKEKKNV